ncbi:uncharacterized protein [Aegilops tauschii subsp. strangulata]|uniref:Dirigent protein n=4 Tax=Aegilops tauschii TaxID=37682 RepID=A0A453Q992_AEGTS|nr:uncharacterized protein LOC109751876 [Aegilops tauschii subsp. strangulata]
MSPQSFTLETTTTTPAAKGSDPSYFQSAPAGHEMIQHKELLLHLYAYQNVQKTPDANQAVIVESKRPECFGILAANDWTVYDDPAHNANLVAHAQGLHLGASMAKENWFICFNMVFVNQRFTGSSFKVMGDFQGTAHNGEWAIVGGTGEFAYAQGVIAFKKTQQSERNARIELHVRAMCLSFLRPLLSLGDGSAVAKIGPWGKMSGELLDIPSTPRRLERITIRHGVVIDSLAFSFIDKAGEPYNVGPWGGPRGDNKDTIELAPSEIVTEVSGTVGIFAEDNVEYNAIASLTITTNLCPYGPFGETQSTPFSVPVQDNNNIVGFFACAGKYVEALGVYVRSPVST